MPIPAFTYNLPSRSRLEVRSMPEVFLPLRRTSLGHLIAGSRPTAVSAARATAREQTIWSRAETGVGGRRMIETAIAAPFSTTHRLSKRPRPAVWSSARMTSAFGSACHGLHVGYVHCRGEGVVEKEVAAHEGGVEIVSDGLGGERFGVGGVVVVGQEASSMSRRMAWAALWPGAPDT